MEYKIPFIRPRFPSSDEIANEIDRIVEANWYTNFGPFEIQFSQALAKYLGQDLRVSTMANGTLALLAAIHCTFGRGESNRFLLLPSFTFIAVAQAAIWNGYLPWFIDIDRHTWQANPESAREALEGNRHDIAGIVLPNALGVGNPRIDEWEDLADEWDLPIVIDSAAGFGSAYEGGRRLGARGSCEIFSFHATKPFAIGEGGALASRDDQLIERIQRFQNFGFSDSRTSVELGMNGKLSELAAAIGLRQLEGFDERLTSRRQTFERYRSALAPLGISFQANAEASSHQCCTICSTSPTEKAAIMRNLENHRVQVRDYYNPPLHRHPYFAKNVRRHASTDLSVTDDVCSRIISLPIWDDMPHSDVALVMRAVTESVLV